MNAVRQILLRGLFLERLSIRARLTLIIAGTVSAVVLLGGLLLLQHDQSRLRQQISVETEAISRVLAQDFARVLMIDTADVAADLVSRLSAFPMILKADLYNMAGERVLHYAVDPDDQEPIQVPGDAMEIFAGSRLIKRTPVSYAQTTLGMVVFDVSMQKLGIRQRNLYATLAALAPLSILFIIVAAYVLQRSFTRPLRLLTDTVRHISTANDYRTRLPVSDNSEFGQLFAGFNHMLQTIEQSAAQLHDQKEKLQVTLQSIAEGVVTTDRDGRIVYMNEVAETLCNSSLQEVSGQPVAKTVRLVARHDRSGMDSPVHDSLRRGQTVKITGECDLLPFDGQPIGVTASAAPIRGSDGTIVGAIMVLVDVTVSRAMAEELSFQASHDALTGLFNRRAFEAQLGSALDGAHARDEQHVLFYMDLDQFKVVNDTCGHAAGDELLKELSQLLRTKIRSGDCLARLGGDEFGIILRHCSLDRAVLISEELLSVVNDFRFDWMGEVFSVGISIGVTSIDQNASDAQQLLANADTACYHAKDAGRNRAYVYKAEDKALSQRVGDMAFVSRLRRVIDEGGLALYAQRILPLQPDADDGHHYEILLRMLDESGRPVAPGYFMPAAERYGLIEQIDRWVISKVIDVLARNPQHLARLHTCSVNLSGLSISQPAFLKFMIGLLNANPQIGAKLCLEVTETAAIGNMAAVTELMQALGEHGVRFALDDFGTGMSSLSYLKNLPVDYVKIDGVFVRDIPEDDVDRGMVRAINELAHVMDKRTVAEFVETQLASDILGEIGVDMAQGFFLHRPEPLDQLLQRLG